MALTTAQFQAWLESDTAVRCTLVEVVANIAGVDTTLYFSTRAFNMDPTNSYGLYRGQNLLTYSEQFNLWADINNATVTANSTTAPNGTLTAETLVSTLTGGGNTCLVDAGVIPALTGTVYTFSVYLKQGTSPTSLVDFYTASPYSECFGVITWGSTPTWSPGGSALLGSSFQAVGGGWYRASLTLSSGASTGLVTRVYVRGQGTNNVSGETVFVWGAQLETGSTVSEYFPTTSTASTNSVTSNPPPNTSYLPIVSESLVFSEQLTLDGSATISYGDLSLTNVNGEYDYFMDYIWAGRSIKIFIGEASDIRANFTQIFSGIVSDIAFKDRNTISISIRSLLEKLNTPIYATTIGGIGTNKDVLRPLLFGECFNITPVLFDPANLVYMVHDGPIERIIEVRDNDVPLIAGTSYTVNAALGTFTLLASPAGTITCSAQGEQNTINSGTGAIVAGTWSSTVAKIIQLIISKYGTNVLSPSDMDLVALSDFDINNSMPVGTYITSATNVINVCQELAASVGAQFTANRNGLVTLVKIDIPNALAGAKYIDDNCIMNGNMTVSQKVPVQGAIKLGYCKNWTVQTTILTGIPDAHKLIYGLEYLNVYIKDDTVRTLYKLSNEPDVIPTLLLSDTSGSITAEATRRLNLWKVPRYVYSMECTAKMLSVTLGEMVSLSHYRFRLQTPVSGQVVTVNTNWNTGRVSLEVLV